MENLPKLPGFNFETRFKSHHGVPHSLDFINGIRVPLKPLKGIGGDPVADDSVAFASESDAAIFDPELTYGRLRHPRIEPFRPHYVRFDRMVLTFEGFFRQQVLESATVQSRVRYVNVMYFLEDDSITIMEPRILNCGFPQGRIVRRSRIPKSTKGDFISWKDLNIGIDLKIFGIVYHLTDCDKATREFMRSQGIILNEMEMRPALPEPPSRPSTASAMVRITPRPPSDVAKVRRSMTYSGKVLTFHVLTDDTDKPAGEIITYKLYYFLEDDTIAIRELKENSEGRDYFPMYLRRTKLRKNNGTVSVLTLLSQAEYDESNPSEFYGPNDLRIGETVFIFGRRFLLTDCDFATRRYYAEVLKDPQPDRVTMQQPQRLRPQTALPEYLGFGTPEDSLASCYGLVPKAPRKDIVKYLLYANKHLRFECTLQNNIIEDQQRHFILKYSLADGTLSIYETAIRNSGINGGRFLSSQKVIKPGGNPDVPEYYTAKDLYLGTILNINSHKFRLVTADFSVYQYMTENPELFSGAAVNDVRALLLNEQRLDPRIKEQILQNTREFHQKQPELLANGPDEISNVNHCLENVHLYGSQEDGTAIEDQRLEAQHREALAQNSKPVLPYHEQDDTAEAAIYSEHKKTVSFDDTNFH